LTAPLVILDIGSTLVTGPERGPASRVARAIGLDTARKRQLHRMLMTTDYADPDQAYASVSAAFELNSSSLKSALIDVWQAQETEARLIPGAPQALRLLIDSGSRLALLSNIWVPYFRSVQRLLGSFLDEHIPAELQLLSYREGLVKPELELFRRVLDRSGSEAAGALMIGDSYDKDMEPAIACGMQTLWLLQEPGRNSESIVKILNNTARRPDVTLRSLADIADGSPAFAWLKPQPSGSEMHKTRHPGGPSANPLV
jgi:FMN phosphatase YigB (HAD superfamily)